MIPWFTTKNINYKDLSKNVTHLINKICDQIVVKLLILIFDSDKKNINNQGLHATLRDCLTL